MYSHKGFMLDVSRHYMPVNEIRRFITAARLCGMNRMHFHLTDDQGWRIEIRKYPRLTEIGSIRGESSFGGCSRTENNNGYYTQDQIREIVAFAAENGIDVIPEIEIPGHASAMLAAYPEAGCRRTLFGRYGERRGESRWDCGVQTGGGIFPNLICAGRDEVIRFLEDILDEVTGLFPFPMVHIGGDEALKLHWRRCPDCRRRMREQGLEDENDLQRWLVMEIGRYLAAKGRETIVWNDVLAGGTLPDYFIVQQWRDGEKETRAFLEGGGRVILSDTRWCYFDYPYGRTDLKTIYDVPRMPEWMKGFEDRLIGTECPLWTERVTNAKRAAFLMFPRLAAAGVLAGEKEKPTWDAYLRKVGEICAAIEKETGLKAAPGEYWVMSPEAAEADRAADQERICAEGARPFARMVGQLVLLDETERLMRKLKIPEDFALRAGDTALAEIMGEDPSDPPHEDGADDLIRQMMQVVYNRKYGPWKGIPEEVWLATMGCYPRFVAEYRRMHGRDGFGTAEWAVRQRDARLFRLGDLEYEMREQDGKREIALHIPFDARLEPEPLNASLAKARTFFREYFPAYADAPMVCDSWLLAPSLKEMLPAASRIRQFQDAFELTERDDEDDAALGWVFWIPEEKRKELKPEELPEDTSLQRAMKKRLVAGLQTGTAKGRLVRKFGEACEASVHEKARELTLALIERKLSITTMESCTSGLVASLITDTEGSSAVMKGAFITYSNEAKILQGVDPAVIDTYGVYSAQTAAAMAGACRKAYGADIGVGVTGNFGNVDPNNADSVPGVVYFAIASQTGTDTFRCPVPTQPSRFAYKLFTTDVILDELLKTVR